MITLIYGGSACGKSEYAENLALSLSGSGKRFYLATMIPYGEEGRQRVERHRSLREGKGFFTIECPVHIEAAAERIREETGGNENAVFLLECVSNLVANEMFDSTEGEDGLAGRVTDGIRRLCRETKHAVIVTNNIFEDGLSYEETTIRYAAHLAEINVILADMADRVVEIVAGIPVPLK